MKFSVNREKIYEIISEYINILTENPVKPILEGLHISVKSDKVVFKGMNNEIELIRYSECDVQEEGEVLIKPQLLLEYIKLLETEKVYFTKENGYLKINDAEFSILDESAYPSLVEISTILIAKEHAKKFAYLLEKIKFLNVSNVADNLYKSIKINFSDNFCELISTDSYRLVYLKENINVNIKKDILIPIESINVMYKLFKDLDAEISLSVNDNKLIIVWKDAYFTCKLSTLEFVDYKSILDNFKYDRTLEFNTEELRSSLRKVISVTKNSIDSKNVASFNFSGNKLSISGYSSSAKINQKVNMIKNGEDIKIGLNCKYLTEFIDNIEKNTIISAQSSSNMLRIKEENNENYLYFLMPVNLRA